MTNILLAISALNPGQALKINPEGTSMCPTFLGGRDSVNVVKPEFPLKRGDIALFQRIDGTYVIHRVYKLRKNGQRTEYFMLGDNQTWIEGPIREDQIHGLTKSILRKGKLIDCETNKLYRFATRVWMWIRPIRPVFIKFWNKIKSR